MIAGYVRHDSYQVGTALLAGEAYADSAIVDLAVKAITRRKRPSDVPDGASFNHTFFSGGKSPFKGSAFPSGHAAGAFSVATIVSSRYHNHRWIPWALYGFATAVSFSRVTTSAHFPRTCFLGRPSATPLHATKCCARENLWMRGTRIVRSPLPVGMAYRVLSQLSVVLRRTKPNCAGAAYGFSDV
jgi:PAP2 superfamily